jgi:hypothetical protein
VSPFCSSGRLIPQLSYASPMKDDPCGKFLGELVDPETGRIAYVCAHCDASDSKLDPPSDLRAGDVV